MRILGIEGTAWAASAAVYDAETDSTFIESDAYEPESGGIHPREAAEHMHTAIPQVVEAALSHARELQAENDESAVDDRAGSGADPPIDAVAFSRGPGLGPCLRIVATAARALAGTLDVPLVGVNHMVAHLEIGRHTADFADPVCLNASGANAHLLAYRNGRYRVLGETMDTGVGNAIDKFTRHVGWSHPGGPKVEAAAADGEYVDLPYVVKGMDFSFSGIMSAAKAAVDDGTPVEDACAGLQETIFAMLTEVAERALSLTGRDELVLGGGVGQNDRLRAMLDTMCEARGATFHAPEPRFLRDNAGMIAVLGAKMYAAGETVAIEESAVDPDFRPDQVDVVWRGDETAEANRLGADEDDRTTVDGAEAVVTVNREAGRVTKRRVPKPYRHPTLDERLRRERTAIEARLTSLARQVGVPTPVIYDVDPYESTITFAHVGDRDLRDALTTERVRAVGRSLATIHDAGFVHGDPTVRNVRVATGSDARRTGPEAAADRPYLIDFGLGYHTDHVEDYAMDLHVFDQSLVGTAPNPAPLREAAIDAYREVGDARVLDRLADVEGRGRYVGE
ncbi:bifunctional UGMP family protein/serine/threonine protein kinase [Halovivax asiaticus JCM 14624]|uniref:Probable bifunctional tRNA threonylcarbamoyladenosine biosynthesis protein n=1 Tax=Halovivax asiaticus JCM 14624 TaxID=1227490 RepID=M0BF18_9EURY|nr:bifunctional N(6)-L-threonylcarbamoyladenine synthase/serine/threonine protein kinase [Halovivax asiaticus]ELZ08898.1 bifunctional UGMP family protein/serine/threonine protein kinase [Halovivax asiaticus JCM 14624]